MNDATIQNAIITAAAGAIAYFAISFVAKRSDENMRLNLAADILGDVVRKSVYSIVAGR